MSDMNDLEKELSSIFDSRDVKLREAADKAEVESQRRDQVRSNFKNAVETIIRPVFESVKPILGRRGVTASIYSDGKQPDLRITIDMVEGSRSYSGTLKPSFSVSGSLDGKVHFHKSTMSDARGGMAGSDGIYDLENLTPQLVQGKLVAVIKESFG